MSGIQIIKGNLKTGQIKVKYLQESGIWVPGVWVTAVFDFKEAVSFSSIKICEWPATNDVKDLSL